MNDEYIVTDELAKILEHNYDVQRKDIRITNEYRASALTWYLRCLADFNSGRLGISRESFTLGYLKEQCDNKKVNDSRGDTFEVAQANCKKELAELERLAEKPKLAYLELLKLRTYYCKIWNAKTGDILGYAIGSCLDHINDANFEPIVLFLNKLQDFVVNSSLLFDSALSLLADEVDPNLDEPFILTSSGHGLCEIKGAVYNKSRSIIQLNGRVNQGENRW